MAQTLEQTPDQAITALDNLLVVIFLNRTTLAGIEMIAAHTTALGLRYPSGIGLLTIVPAKAPPPPNEVRGRLAAVLGAATQVKGSALCFEGTGLRATIVRSVVTGLTILSHPPFPHKVFGLLAEGVAFANQHLAAAGAPTWQNSRVVTEIESWRTSLSLPE